MTIDDRIRRAVETAQADDERRARAEAGELTADDIDEIARRARREHR